MGKGAEVSPAQENLINQLTSIGERTASRTNPIQQNAFGQIAAALHGGGNPFMQDFTPQNIPFSQGFDPFGMGGGQVVPPPAQQQPGPLPPPAPIPAPMTPDERQNTPEAQLPPILRGPGNVMGANQPAILPNGQQARRSSRAGAAPVIDKPADFMVSPDLPSQPPAASAPPPQTAEEDAAAKSGGTGVGPGIGGAGGGARQSNGDFGSGQTSDSASFPGQGGGGASINSGFATPTVSPSNFPSQINVAGPGGLLTGDQLRGQIPGQLTAGQFRTNAEVPQLPGTLSQQTEGTLLGALPGQLGASSFGADPTTGRFMPGPDPLAGQIQTTALSRLQNPLSAQDILGQAGGAIQNQLARVDENAAARGALNSSQRDLRRDQALADFFFRANDVANQQNQLAFANAQGAQGQQFGQGLAGFQTNLGAQGQEFGQAAQQFGLNEQARQAAIQNQFGAADRAAALQNQFTNQGLNRFSAQLAGQGQQFGQELGAFGANEQARLAAQQANLANFQANAGLNNQLFGQAQTIDQINDQRNRQNIALQENLRNVRRQEALQPLNFAFQALGLGQGGQQLQGALSGLNQSIGTNAQVAAANPLAQLAGGLGGLGGTTLGAKIGQPGGII